MQYRIPSGIYISNFGSEETRCEKTILFTKFYKKMKRLVLKNWMVATLLTGACCGFVACDDDNDGTPPATPDATAVIGDYAGTMAVAEVVPSEGEAEEPVGTALDAKVTAEAIEFTNFPIRDLIATILKDASDEEIDAIVGAVGPIDYAISYTAQMSEDKATVEMSLEPEVLNIALGDPAEGGLEIAVKITAAAGGAYSLDSKKLGFLLAVEQITLGDGAPIDAALNLEFDLAKK